MLKIYYDLSELSFGNMMMVYEESNRLNASELYGSMDANAALLQVEQDFYAYLQGCFFQTNGAWYAVWEEEGKYISALRMEPFLDGLLLEALETMPQMRRRGYAYRLMEAVLKLVEGNVYSHIHKENHASYALHLRCGFSKISNDCVYIDGSSSDCCCTMLRGKVQKK